MAEESLTTKKMPLMKILLVEDDKFVSAALANMLAANHYSIDLAADEQTGLERVLAVEYDLILLDLQSPKLDVINLCHQLRSNGYRHPILLLTEKDANDDIAAGLEAGADDYVIKPYAPEELLARIRALLRQRGASVSLFPAGTSTTNGGAITCGNTISESRLSSTLTPSTRSVPFCSP